MDFKKLPDFISLNAARHPDKPCIFFKDKVYSYRDVNDIVLKVGNVLIANGVKKGDRVVLLMGNCPEFIFSYFGVSAIGAVIVPQNIFLKEAEVSTNMNDCGAEYIITSNAFGEVIKGLQPLVPQMKKIFTYEDNNFNGVNIKTSPHAKAEQINTPIDYEDLTAIIYTSGTTGKPKGVMLTHHNLIVNSLQINQGVEARETDITMLVLPMFHSFTWVACVSGPLRLGGGIAILESVMDMSKEGYYEWLMKIRPTLMLGVPQVYAAMVRAKYPDEVKKNMPFRSYFSGGAPMPVETINQFFAAFHVPLVEGYGMSEASPGAAVNPRSGIQKPGTIGLPLPGIEMKIVDENDNELPINTPGELCIRGENVMKGYWNQPEETAKTLRNGWLHTGDVATKDEDGYYTIVDRIKDLIITKGMNVYPREIEEMLHHYKGIANAAVIGVPDKDGSEVVIAYVKPEQDTVLKERDIKEYLREKLAAFKIPRKVIFTDNIPVNASGKIMKKELKARYASENE